MLHPERRPELQGTGRGSAGTVAVGSGVRSRRRSPVGVLSKMPLLGEGGLARRPSWRLPLRPRLRSTVPGRFPVLPRSSPCRSVSPRWHRFSWSCGPSCRKKALRMFAPPRRRQPTVETAGCSIGRHGRSQPRPETPRRTEERDEKLDEAIAAFRAILVDSPELVRVRLELARAFFLKGEDTLARRHFEQVLAGRLPPPVAAICPAFPRTHPRPAALGGALRRGARARQQSQHRLRQPDDLARHALRAPALHSGRGYGPQVWTRRLDLGRGRIPVSADGAAPAALRGGCLDPRIQGRPVRPVSHRCLSRAALAYRCPDGSEPARHRAAAMDRRPPETRTNTGSGWRQRGA